MAPLVLPDSAAVGSAGLASCEWSDEVEIDGAGDGLGGCICVVVCPFIVQEMAGVFGDGGVGRDLRVGTFGERGDARCYCRTDQLKNR